MLSSVRLAPLLHATSLTRLVAHNLNWYRFIGRIIGKAMYEGILVDIAFAGFFLAKVRMAQFPSYSCLTRHSSG
jgi:hypothetical protein